MARKSPSHIRSLLLRAGPAALGVVFMGFFVYFAVAGPNGALAFRDYDRQLEAREREFAELDRKRAELRNRVDQLDPRRANPDLAEELVRKDLNLVHPDEVIIPLR